MTDLIQVLNDLPAAALFFALLFGTFLSEDAACIAAGAAAARGQIGIAAAITACFVGIFVGDMLLYGAGRAFGGRVFDNRVARRLVSDATRSKASLWLERNAAAAVFLSRFVTGLRLPTYLAAGALRTDLKKFTAYFLLASAVWTPILVGSAALSQSTVFGKSTLLGAIGLFMILRLTIKYSSWTNRRLFVGRLKRIVKWEFWPVQIFYVPVVVYVLWLAAKHRSLTVFTAANPAFPAGGFKGESKNDIYNALDLPGNGRFLLAHTLIQRCDSLAVRLRRAWRFMGTHSLDFPLIIKPDAGERGENVRIIRSFDELSDALTGADDDVLLQEYVDGDEISVFYYRRPHEEQGHIFSITEKSFPFVIGDGRSTIEQLILRDARAVCMAGKYFEQLGDGIDRVPAAGEVVRLIDIGTHSRGAVFREGGWLRTEAFENAIDQVCLRVDGFFFGRFDIRARSFADLQYGSNFKIIELNGVTSESTNIYDPRYLLFDAYRILFQQWRLAFEIGLENIKLGARPTGVLELAKLAFGMRPRTGPTDRPVDASLAASHC